MAHYTSTIRGPGNNVSNSHSQSIKPTKMMDVHDSSSTDHSIFIGFGPNAKRIKDRFEETKKQLCFENNFVALKWLLDSFVDDYLRSKNMKDTATLTRNAVFIKRERRVDEGSSTQSRRPASHSPSKTRFNDTVTESKENGIADCGSESRQHVPPIRETKSSDGSRVVSGDLHIPGQYSFKYGPEYWSPYYSWHNNVPSRMVNVSSLQGYPSYVMMKTPSCSSLPTRGDPYKVVSRSESLKQLNRENSDERRELSTSGEKRAPVHLGFKTKSMPNLQFIPKESEVNSGEEDEVESDQETQGDLVALSSSSLSMPNLRKIPPDRGQLLSPPSHGPYEPIPLRRDRHDVCNPSSFSMPNLKQIQGIEHVDTKKTIQDFVRNRLAGPKDHEQNKTKIFNPDGYYQQSSLPDSARKRLIRKRLLNRLERRKREETTQTPGSHHNGKMTAHMTSHLKFAKTLSHDSLWPGKNYMHARLRDERVLEKDDHANNNNWKVPLAVGSFESRNMLNHSPAKKGHTNSGIWNPADVHVKKENSPTGPRSDVSPQPTMISSVNQDGGEELPSASTSSEERPMEEDDRGDEGSEEISRDEEEHVDVENVKEDDMDESEESESDPEDNTSDDERKNKRTRKTDKPRKRLKAM